MPAPYRPMLATAGALPTGPRWRYEPKFDGWRLLVSVDEHGVSAYTRPGRNVTAQLPELGPLADAGRAMVLDGELVAHAGRGWDFYRVAPRVAYRPPNPIERRRTHAPLTFVAFDVLALDGALLLHATYEHRRHLLETLKLSGPHWTTTPVYDDADALMDGCVELGLEGVVAKHQHGIYRPGERSRHWVKRKTPEWRSVHAQRRTNA